MEKEEKQRIPELDILKGIAIIMVVLGHVTIPFITDYHNNLIFQICYSFHMPLFIFVSGYLDGFRNSMCVNGGGVCGGGVLRD